MKLLIMSPPNTGNVGTSTMVSAICYAWLLENRVRRENKKSKAGNTNEDEEYVVVPVINVKRGRMWKQREAAWLFYHVGLDVTSLLFSDEVTTFHMLVCFGIMPKCYKLVHLVKQFGCAQVDLECLMMAGKLNILVTGQDILRNNGEVGSQCTILTDNYCEDAYELLDNLLLKKLLVYDFTLAPLNEVFFLFHQDIGDFQVLQLAGILLDTQNLKASSQLSMTRDAEAVQLLLVGLPSNYRNALFDQCTNFLLLWIMKEHVACIDMSNVVFVIVYIISDTTSGRQFLS